MVALPFVRFAYRAPALHVVLETTNAIIAALVAFLVYGRFRENRRMQELLLVLGLCSVATANLVLTALPAAATIGHGVEADPWAGLALRLVGILLVAGAALTPPSSSARGHQPAIATAALVAGIVLIGALSATVGDRLPPPVNLSHPPGNGSGPALVSHPAVLAVQALGALLYAIAALWFTGHARRTGDELLRWVGAGCVLGSASRVHYLLFPSLYSDYVYTGDVLRLASYAFMLVGAAREIRSYWELREQNAVLEDRRRMARDLHDGLTQELSYISAQSQRLAARPGDTAVIERIETAAGRALDEARRAIAALTHRPEEAFPQQLQHLVEDMAHRYDVTAVTDLETTAEVDPAQAEALLRIVGEAVRNGVRHGHADRMEIRLRAQPLCLAVSDNGQGFPVGRNRPGAFGITSMRERARALGAELEIQSTPGEGTRVRITWP